MKAVVYTRYGMPDVLSVQEVARPVPKANEVLVKVAASSINAADWLFLTGPSPLVRMMAGGLDKPKQPILGNDVAGRVEAVGASVTRFKPGDEVYGDLSSSGMGGFAEYAVAPETMLAPKPARLSFEEAAAVPLAGVTALQGLRDKGGLQAGQELLIVGASSGVGSFAVQLARHIGAHVTATASTAKLDRVRALGADRVIDHSREDITQSGRSFDLILDIAAYRPFGDYRRILRPGGRYVLVGGALGRIFRAMLLGPLASLRGGRTFTALSAKANAADLAELTALLDAGALVPAVDRCYPLAETAEAFRYFGSRHARGKVVISMA